jgi:tetratricopeptide (TPR) repeat protein
MSQTKRLVCLSIYCVGSAVGQEPQLPQDSSHAGVALNGLTSPLASPALIFPHPEGPPSTHGGGLQPVSARHVAHKPPKAAVREFKAGLKLKLKGKIEEAGEHLTEASRLDPGYWEAHANLADVLWRRGRVSDALEQLELAIAIDPNYESLHSNKVVALLALKRPAEAEAAARRALQLAPHSASAHYLLGSALLQQGRIDAETASHFAEAADTYPQARSAFNAVREQLTNIAH